MPASCNAPEGWFDGLGAAFCGVMFLYLLYKRTTAPLQRKTTQRAKPVIVATVALVIYAVSL
jgi:hypothetical protein